MNIILNENINNYLYTFTIITIIIISILLIKIIYNKIKNKRSVNWYIASNIKELDIIEEKINALNINSKNKENLLSQLNDQRKIIDIINNNKDSKDINEDLLNIENNKRNILDKIKSYWN